MPQRSERALLPALVLLALAGPVWLAPAGCAEPDTPARPSFLLVVADTLRADRLHFAGYEAPHTPHLDALRDQSVWFSNAYSTSPWTLPSMTSVFTSQFGAEHGVVQWGSMVGPEHTTLAEVLQQAGYATAAWSANFWLAPVRGLSQGFEEYERVAHPNRHLSQSKHDEYVTAPARAVFAKGLAWLEALRAAEPEKPYFAYLHVMEPHTPYRCPGRAPPACRETLARLNQRLINREWKFTPAERDFLQERYAGEVAQLDRVLGRFLDLAGKRGLLEHTWILFVADHGELLGERGSYLHGKFLYQPLVHVPLLVSAPSRVAGTVATPVSLIDLAPTVLELAGAEVPKSFRGRSLVAALRGEILAPRPVVAELYMDSPLTKHRFAVVDGDQKYIFATDESVERFDVARDPGEEHPLAADRDAVQGLLDAAGVAFDLDFVPDASVPPVTPELREQLEALGYAP